VPTNSYKDFSAGLNLQDHETSVPIDESVNCLNVYGGQDIVLRPRKGYIPVSTFLDFAGAPHQVIILTSFTPRGNWVAGNISYDGTTYLDTSFSYYITMGASRAMDFGEEDDALHYAYRRVPTNQVVVPGQDFTQNPAVQIVASSADHYPEYWARNSLDGTVPARMVAKTTVHVDGTGLPFLSDLLTYFGHGPWCPNISAGPVPWRKWAVHSKLDVTVKCEIAAFNPSQHKLTLVLKPFEDDETTLIVGDPLWPVIQVDFTYTGTVGSYREFAPLTWNPVVYVPPGQPAVFGEAELTYPPEKVAPGRGARWPSSIPWPVLVDGPYFFPHLVDGFGDLETGYGEVIYRPFLYRYAL
jgi:hypothetical protein